MSSTQPRQSNVASLPPPKCGVLAVLPSGAESAVLPNFAHFTPSPRNRQTNGFTNANHQTFGAWHVRTAVGPFLANSLHNRWESYRGQLRNCQENFSEEAVHELRVATRRLMAQIVMLGCVIPGKIAENARVLLKRRLKALGELRDVHVQRLFVEKQMTRFPELLFVRDFLQRRERRLERAAAEKVRDFKTRKLEKWVSRLSEHLVGKHAKSGDAVRLSTLVVQAADQAFVDVAHRRRAIAPAHPSTVHRTRIAFKKFRYMVEALSPDLTGFNKADLRSLACYQKRMGVLQDLEVMQECVQDFAQNQGSMKTLLEPFNRYLQNRRARALRTFLESADDLFRFWPPGRMHHNGNGAIPEATTLAELPLAKAVAVG